MQPYDRRYLKGLTGVGLAIIGLSAYRFFFPIHSLPGVFIATLIAGIIFLAAVFALGLDHEDKDFARLSLPLEPDTGMTPEACHSEELNPEGLVARGLVLTLPRIPSPLPFSPPPFP